MTQNGFVVEFLGLPGVGKSTLAFEVMKTLHAKGIPAQLAYQSVRGASWFERRLHSSFDISKLILRKPHYVYLSSRAIHSSKQRSHRDQLKVTHNWLSVSARTLRASRVHGITLFDQGIFQALWSIGYSAEEVNLLDIAIRLNTSMPKPNLLVLVQAEQSTVIRRLTARGGGGSRLALKPSGVAQVLARAEELLKEVKGVAQYISSQDALMEVLELDNDSDNVLEVNACRTVEAVSRMLPTHLTHRLS